jgi:bidirectional [NiFe] hydrogenase diaphorase subunit
MDLAELHQIAEHEHQARKPLRIRCCVAAGCLSANAQAVKQRLEESVAGAGLQERVEVCGVGCLRLCSRGPLIQVDPDGALYENVTPDTAPAIVAALDASGATIADAVSGVTFSYSAPSGST